MQKRCFGITSLLNLRRCQRLFKGKYPYCEDHKRQPVYFLLTLFISVLIALFSSYLSPNTNSERNISKENLMIKFTSNSWEEFQTKQNGTSFTRTFKIINNSSSILNLERVSVGYSIGTVSEISYHNFNLEPINPNGGIENGFLITRFLKNNIKPEDIKLTKVIIKLAQSKDSISYENFKSNQGYWY